MIEATINAQTADYLPEEKLARMLKNMEFSPKYMVHIFNFFTDVPLQDIAKFIAKHNIPEATLLEYYKTYVQEFYRNVELEEMLEHVGRTFGKGHSSS
ncbi:hypothetical protein SAMN00808754_0810 [Thermanaeromonas toyohensis ToBE]|uniref:Uncharacterized protein n=2 Tax=Thermanaeromonas TaxID=202949 RepID=A0A1W1VIH8_9FIRM|nr:hypothetical protein SAMN00808754_0810 [Thermanaeromonas toyohensis ToBE]